MKQGNIVGNKEIYFVSFLNVSSSLVSRVCSKMEIQLSQNARNAKCSFVATVTSLTASKSPHGNGNLQFMSHMKQSMIG